MLDRLSTASIVAGEALLATSVYLAFLRRPEPARLGARLEPPRFVVMLEPSRCGVALRF